MQTETSAPKTTRPLAKQQREKPVKKTAAAKLHRKLDSFPDKVDVRDWIYQPLLAPLPDQIINCDKVPAILNQGQEGACTGFAMAANINFHLAVNGRCKAEDVLKLGASPRMLYELARKYDEWPGEHYEGSSARGTIKGWVAHGVVQREKWKDNVTGLNHFDETMAKQALDIPAGAYYRVMHRNIRDMQAALFEAGILFCTLMVHDGWDDPKNSSKTYHYNSADETKTIKLPIIERSGRANDGHAVAIVGYTREGFIIQNSWGRGWGNKGFAVLPYEDWMLHASDCWVTQLGVPIDVDLWSKGYADTDAGKQRASQIIPLQQIRPYVINIGNNGLLSDSGMYWTTQQDITRMFQNIETVSAAWKKKRVLLYLHGGLNSEKDVARRIIAFKQVFLENEIYPVHIMWETDFWTSLKDEVFDLFTNTDRAGTSWLNKLREGTLEILDRTFEITASKPGRALWGEMKENARLSAEPGRAMDIVANEALSAFANADSTERNNWELHIVGHSAGSIFTAYAIDALIKIGVPIKSVQFMAPAITIELFNKKLLPHIQKNDCPLPVMYILSDVGERDDDVGPYGKSLLYLVSNAFEEKRDTPILGMERFINGRNRELDKNFIDATISKLFNTSTNELPNLVIAGAAAAEKNFGASISRSDSHGGFDNDPFTMNSILYRILGRKPKNRLFDVRDLQF
ncbi:MAG TPA: C1 family peptidase [Parafilimonas sp.]|nr:C1 family peptidase [Parafilimonas sp.]